MFEDETTLGFELSNKLPNFRFSEFTYSELIRQLNTVNIST